MQWFGGAHHKLIGAAVLAAGLLVFSGPAGCQQKASSHDHPDQANTPPANPALLKPNRPPSVREARIVPHPVRRQEPARVQVEGEDPDGDPLAYRYQWLVNDRPLPGETREVLDPSRFQRGNLLRVEVVPSDGKEEGPTFRTPAIEVVNSPPEVTAVVLEPDPLRVGQPVQAKAEGLDADQDFIRYTFKWWRNNLLLDGGKEGTLETKGFVRRDTVVVQAIPHDSEGPGKPKYSEPLTISNSAPNITSKPPTAINQGRYEYAVTAVDPDGDPLTFKLESAPAGMSIDSATGRVFWDLTPSSYGTHRVRVAVEDGQGGGAHQEFELRLATPPAQEPASS